MLLISNDQNKNQRHYIDFLLFVIFPMSKKVSDVFEHVHKKESQNVQFYQFKIYGVGRVMVKKQLFKYALINISI